MLSFYLLHVQLFISELFYHTIHSNFYILFIQFYTFKFYAFKLSNFIYIFKLSQLCPNSKAGAFPKTTSILTLRPKYKKNNNQSGKSLIKISSLCLTSMLKLKQFKLMSQTPLDFKLRSLSIFMICKLKQEKTLYPPQSKEWT
jgi:hypothetical protein